MIKEGMQEINCNYAYEPIYSYSDAKILYDQLVKVSDYLFDNNLSQLYYSNIILSLFLFYKVAKLRKKDVSSKK